MSDRLRLDLVLNDFVASALSTGCITVLSDGSPWRPLINVQDMARAIEWAVTRDTQLGDDHLVVNVGSNDWNYQVRDLAEAVAAAIPGTKVSINREAPPDKRSYRVDFSRFRTLAPGHVPEVTLADTVKELRSGLQAMRFNNADFRNSSFMRLKVLEQLRARCLLNNALEWVSLDADVVRSRVASSSAL
jgi:nucleoside-diphosphate-sugar epimerase